MSRCATAGRSRAPRAEDRIASDRCPTWSYRTSPTPIRAATCCSPRCRSASRRASTSALVGANGVGKSTLFRVLAGLLPADDGDVDIGAFAYMAQDVGAGATTAAQCASCCSRPRRRACGRPASGCSPPTASSPPAPIPRARECGWARRSASGPSWAATSSRVAGTPPAAGSSAPASTRSGRA